LLLFDPTIAVLMCATLPNALSMPICAPPYDHQPWPFREIARLL
jgi:hypothetical protein